MCRLFIGADRALWESETRSIRIGETLTSIRLEIFFWFTLEEIAARDRLTVNQLITTLYQEAIDADHNLGNFTSFLRVCCGRYMSLQLSGDVPSDCNVSIRSLKAEEILQKERHATEHRHLHLVK